MIAAVVILVAALAISFWIIKMLTAMNANLRKELAAALECRQHLIDHSAAHHRELLVLRAGLVEIADRVAGIKKAAKDA